MKKTKRENVLADTNKPIGDQKVKPSKNQQDKYLKKM